MSGTSLDGIDLACCLFTFENNQYNFKLEFHKCINYSNEWKEKLNNAMQINAYELQLLDFELAELFSEEINLFIHENNIKDIDRISSHGHTIFHQPLKKISLQIGAGQIIAANTKIDTVCDFRKSDLAWGGQGAPLVPIGDQFLFPSYDYCLNIGGIANVSFLQDGRRIAYDICAANMVSNFYAKKLNQEYDLDGNIAASGTLHLDLLNELDSLDYYSKAFPKSLGKEDVDSEIIRIIEKYDISIEDKLRTFIEHIATQIAANCSTWGNRSTSALVTGGGAYNNFLIEKIREKTNTEFIIPEKEIIEFKEAIVFAFLGYLHAHGINNCLSSVTGAIKDHCSGQLYNA